MRTRLGKPWSERLRLRDGRELILRPIRAADAKALRDGFQSLTPEEVRFRFLHPMSELTPAQAQDLADIDRRRAFALVLTEPDEFPEPRIGAVARVAINSDTDDAEFAVVVGAELRGHGLATYMLRKLLDWCRRKRVQSMYGDVMVENQAMLDVCKGLGFLRMPQPEEPGMVRVRKILCPSAPGLEAGADDTGESATRSRR